MVWKVFTQTFTAGAQMFDPASHTVTFDHRFKLRTQVDGDDHDKVPKMTTFEL